MTRVITVLLGRNQDFTAAEAILTKFGATRIEGTTVDDGIEALEACIESDQWREIMIALNEAEYDLD
jgi:lysophospholipid acyltransferase (LPLAT)-like uncharacterized protein